MDFFLVIAWQNKEFKAVEMIQKVLHLHLVDVEFFIGMWAKEMSIWVKEEIIRLEKK